MYIPIFKNRTIEISVAKELIKAGISNKTIPMFEIVQEKSRSNSDKLFCDDLSEIFSDTKHPFFVDISKNIASSSTSAPIKEFLAQVIRNKDFVISHLANCSKIEGFVPVLSYNSKEIINDFSLNKDISLYKLLFGRIALRITPMQFNNISEINKIGLSANDFFMLDIDDKNHSNPAIKKYYRLINSWAKSTKINSIILNSNRPNTFFNNKIIDGEPIENIDNSLLEVYNTASYGFIGFGDYAGISNSLPTTGGAISPAGIYYSKNNNFFVGYKGREMTLSEFQTYIAPAIVGSIYWSEYNEEHHEKCPGCKKIKSIINGDSSGKNQGIWKGITMAHYIYTVDNMLNE